MGEHVDKRILTVEDNTLVQQVYTSALRTLDCDVVAAAGDQREIHEAGADSYLPKPIKVDQFISTVRSLLEQ